MEYLSALYSIEGKSKIYLCYNIGIKEYSAIRKFEFSRSRLNYEFSSDGTRRCMRT
jgi:hypothetical protein